MSVGLRGTSTEHVHVAHVDSAHADADLSQQLPSRCQRTAAQLASLKHARRHAYSVKPLPSAAMSPPSHDVCGYVIQSFSAMGESDGVTLGELLGEMVTERVELALSEAERVRERVGDGEACSLRERLSERVTDTVGETEREPDRVGDAVPLAVELGEVDGLGSH